MRITSSRCYPYEMRLPCEPEPVLYVKRGIPGATTEEGVAALKDAGRCSLWQDRGTACGPSRSCPPEPSSGLPTPSSGAMPVAGYKRAYWLHPLAGVGWHSSQGHSIPGRTVMTTIVGIHPRPQHHTAAALDAQAQVQGVQQFANSPEGLEACLVWLEDLGEVRLAVEGPTQTFL
jgi:hypothetical protein